MELREMVATVVIEVVRGGAVLAVYEEQLFGPLWENKLRIVGKARPEIGEIPVSREKADKTIC